MRHIIFLFFFVCTFFAGHQAQSQGLFSETGYYDQNNWFSNEYYWYSGFYSTPSARLKELLKKNGITGYDRKIFFLKKGQKKDTPSREYIENFDKNGNITHHEFKRNGKSIKQYEFTYNNAGKYTELKKIRKGKLKQHQIVEYNDSNKVTSFTLLKNNDKKLKQKRISTYSPEGKLIKQVYYAKDGKTEDKRWEYDYYDNGKQKENRYYKKGKLKHKYVYSCDNQGKEIKKNTSQVCKIKQYNRDSTYEKISRTTDSKGRIRKSVTTYDKYDREIAYRWYNNKGVLVYGFDYTYSQERNLVLSYTSYKRGGKISGKQEWVYNDINQLVKVTTYGRNNKLKNIKEYQYDTGNQLVSRKVYDKRHQLITRYEYVNNSHGNVVKTTTYDKKDKPENIYEVSYTYNQ
ncbi:MAG: hypothetical protein DRP35_05820 [Candidatus Zixiibacteriota bacterium]|nr:MAG: hypothetical protein DRP35_05820 [candidate division Zixibacteria bacterium]